MRPLLLVIFSSILTVACSHLPEESRTAKDFENRPSLASVKGNKRDLATMQARASVGVSTDLLELKFSGDSAESGQKIYTLKFDYQEDLDANDEYPLNPVTCFLRTSFYSGQYSAASYRLRPQEQAVGTLSYDELSFTGSDDQNYQFTCESKGPGGAIATPAPVSAEYVHRVSNGKIRLTNSPLGLNQNDSQ